MAGARLPLQNSSGGQAENEKGVSFSASVGSLTPFVDSVKQIPIRKRSGFPPAFVAQQWRLWKRMSTEKEVPVTKGAPFVS
jgi:hypothetical protein